MNTLLKLIFVTLGVISLVWISYWIVYTFTHDFDSDSPKDEISVKIGTLFLVQGSALKGIAIPSFFRPQTLANLVYDVVDCESKWEHYDKDGNILVGDKDKKYQAFGITQTQKRTFSWLSGLAGKELDLKSEADQLELLEWAIINNYGCHWTCFQWITGECK